MAAPGPPPPRRTTRRQGHHHHPGRTATTAAGADPDRRAVARLTAAPRATTAETEPRLDAPKWSLRRLAGAVGMEFLRPRSDCPDTGDRGWRCPAAPDRQPARARAGTSAARAPARAEGDDGPRDTVAP